MNSAIRRLTDNGTHGQPVVEVFRSSVVQESDIKVTVKEACSRSTRIISCVALHQKHVVG